MRRTCSYGVFVAMLLVGMATNGLAVTKGASQGLGFFSSTVEDQKGVAITIYNVNLGLVKDRREIRLPEGERELRFMDVASKIIPTSVYVRCLTDPRGLRILEQDYEYDLLNPQKLLDKYVGKEVKLYYKNPYTEREEMVTATLLSNNGGPIFKIGEEITFGHPGRIIFPKVPENLISRPTLVWLMENKLSGPQMVETSYLTDDINWVADYIVTLNEKDDRADLSGWVSIHNKSGATYRDAKLKLVAGDIRRVKDKEEYRRKMLGVAVKEAMPAEPQFEEEEFFEYHLYTLQRSATIKQNQTKQIGFVSADTIPVRKELLFRGTGFYYRSRIPRPMPDQKVGVFVEIENKKEHNLGIPLPKGTFRVYKHDREGSIQFIGEDSVDHTPKDEKMRIRIGDAFDVVGSRKQTDWRKIAYDTYEASFEISLRNRKKEDVLVKVVEPIPGDWVMLSSSHEYVKTEAFTAEFEVRVPREKEATLTYRVRMRF